MMPKEIEEGNKLIAEFMGGVFYEKGNVWKFPIKMEVLANTDKCNPIFIKYHSSWDWLMLVVEKIETFSNGYSNLIGVNMFLNSCTIRDNKNEISRAHSDTKINATYRAVLKFINWYNKKNK